MFGQTYYWQSLRRYVVAFGILFTDVILKRTDSSGVLQQAMKVPLSYAPKDKMLARVLEDPTLTKQAAIVLPRMSFAYTSMMYDGYRKLNTIERVVRRDPNNPNKLLYQYNPVPINIEFSLYVYAKSAEDGTQIVEQIIPYFTPDWTVKIQIIPEMDLVLAVPIVLKSITIDDLFDGAFVNRRTLVWTLNFTLKGMLYGPAKSAPIIKFANERFFFGIPAENNVSDVVNQLQVTPGMLANGSPTSNASLSIDPLLIDIEDDWQAAVNASGMTISFE